MKSKELLQRARLSVMDGWCQGSYYEDANGNPCGRVHAARHCAMGALIQASVGYGDTFATHSFSRAARMLQDQVTRLEGNGLVNVQQWNDEPGRTKQEVVELYNKALAACEDES